MLSLWVANSFMDMLSLWVADMLFDRHGSAMGMQPFSADISRTFHNTATQKVKFKDVESYFCRLIFQGLSYVM